MVRSLGLNHADHHNLALQYLRSITHRLFATPPYLADQVFMAEGKPERIHLLLQQPLILGGYHPHQGSRRVCLQHRFCEAYAPKYLGCRVQRLYRYLFISGFSCSGNASAQVKMTRANSSKVGWVAAACATCSSVRDSNDERPINYSAPYSVTETIWMYAHQTHCHFIRRDIAAVNQNGKRKWT